MCSIEGFTGKHDFTIKEFTAFNKERGPDDTGYYEDEHVAIGHNLLSIYDNPSNLKQPFMDGKGCVLTYNGEIYAHHGQSLPEGVIDTLWLSSQLTPKNVYNPMNHPAINTAGFKDFYDEVDGMWAFAYYNPHARTILLCRDHFGVKPLYYLEFRGNLFWSSTMKPLIAVLRHYGKMHLIDDAGLWIREADGWIIPPHTHVNRIKTVFPGQYLTWNIDQGRFTRMNGCLWRESEWNLRPNYNYDPEEFEEILVDSVKKCFNIGEHKKAISLSGGLDSTLLLGIAKDMPIDLMTTTVRFEGKIDEDTHVPYMGEADIALKTSEWSGIPHSEATCTEEYEDDMFDVYSRLNQYIWLASRVIPRFYNIQNAHKNGAKIYFTGDLADEIVTGYGNHQNYFINRDRGGIQSYGMDRLGLKKKFISGVYDQFADWFPFDETYNGDEVNNNLFLRLLQSTDSFCTVVDHLCGSLGMESRVPYLYQRWAKYALRIPSATKLRLPYEKDTEETVAIPIRRSHGQKTSDGRWTMDRQRGSYKWLFREEMKDYLPDHVRKDKEKVGFSTPWNSRNQSLNNEIRVNEIRSLYPDLLNNCLFECTKLPEGFDTK